MHLFVKRRNQGFWNPFITKLIYLLWTLGTNFTNVKTSTHKHDKFQIGCARTTTENNKILGIEVISIHSIEYDKYVLKKITVSLVIPHSW